jgi:hypothetical protein
MFDRAQHSLPNMLDIENKNPNMLEKKIKNLICLIFKMTSAEVDIKDVLKYQTTIVENAKL